MASIKTAVRLKGPFSGQFVLMSIWSFPDLDHIQTKPASITADSTANPAAATIVPPLPFFLLRPRLAIHAIRMKLVEISVLFDPALAFQPDEPHLSVEFFLRVTN
ncbi:hypothetical protein [Mesorhizobium sp. L2C085B000]|uniref:hypothetical protein n=1 Tax=Mesorhizobium sp. L2C085B000 TaxID=1287117 RepID=UPI00040E286E|nr:hypothetical protein [Mesorhizobium sp. L2C085B000]